MTQLKPATSPASAEFASLSLSPPTLANLQQLGYTTMTPIQAASLPIALQGKDLIAQAKTGSGKTAAFAIPAILQREHHWRYSLALVLTTPLACAGAFVIGTSLAH